MNKKTIKWKNCIVSVLFLLFIMVSFHYIDYKTQESKSPYHSSQLKKIITEDQRTERIDYVDYDGKLTIAADFGFATSISLITNEGKIVKYYDEKGEPIKRASGFYGLFREYDENGNNIQITYLDVDDQPVLIREGYATEKRAYDDNQHIISIRYYDTKGEPVCTAAYGYGRYNEYDENGLNIQTTFIDSSGQPMMTRQGYAAIIRQYYPYGGENSERVENEFYFDEQGDPVALSLGQYGLHKEYNELGQGTVLTYLDQDGKPTVTTKGYTTIKRTFKADNSVATEQYFDAKGNPFSLTEGQYGVKREKGETIFLDEKGRETFNLRNLLYNKTWVVIPIALIVIFISSTTSKKWNVFFILLSILTIVYLTLMYRDSIGNKGQKLLASYRNIFTNSEGRTDIIRNIWLFIPFGAILYKLCPHIKVLLIPFVLSVAIETIQYYTSMGFCELDDIISNSLGGCIGFYTGKLTEEFIDRINKWNRIHSA